MVAYAINSSLGIWDKRLCFSPRDDIEVVSQACRETARRLSGDEVRTGRPNCASLCFDSPTKTSAGAMSSCAPARGEGNPTIRKSELRS